MNERIRLVDKAGTIVGMACMPKVGPQSAGEWCVASMVALLIVGEASAQDGLRWEIDQGLAKGIFHAIEGKEWPVRTLYGKEVRWR